MIIQNGTILTPEGVFVSQDMSCGETIQAFGKLTPEHRCSGDSCSFEPVVDATNCYVVPGLVDIHSHGAMGMDSSDGDPQAMDILSRYYASQGVTAWCPTTMTLQPDTLEKAVKVLGAYTQPVGAKVAGIYLEGPFFHDHKRGAQARENLALPDYALFQRLQEASQGKISVLALAPELEGALPLIAQVSPTCTLSLGHTTTDYDTAQEAFAQGASLVTHLFNGMMPFTHRAPALVGAAFDSQAYAEIIADGLHIHPAVLRVAKQLFGKRLCLVSDSIRCAGMPDGDYTLGGQPVTKEGVRVTLADGTLAGSSIGLLTGVQNVISYGFTPQEAFYSASTAPAQAIRQGDTIGSLAVGKSADFLLLDQDFQLISTFVNGKLVYQRESD